MDPAEIVRTTLMAVFAGDTAIFGRHPGLAGMQKTFPGVLRGFPDFSAELRQQIVDGDRVASHWAFRGTHTGRIFGIAPTGRRVEFENVSIARVQDGRIVQYTSEVGWLHVLIQVGVLPLKQ